MITFLVSVIICFAYAGPARTHAAQVKTVTLPVGHEGQYNISSEVEYIIKITNLTCLLEESPPRLEVSCLECVESNPVLVVVRQRKGVLSWELPLDSFSPSEHNKTLFHSTARTLCPYDVMKSLRSHGGNNGTDNDLTMSLSSSSPTSVTVNLRITLETDFVLTLGQQRNVSLTAATPRFYVYNFPNNPNLDSVLLHVQSSDDTCMTVSVQHIQCPVFDLERNVELDGSWQSVTRSSGITIPREKFPDGFYVVFVVRAHNDDCDHEFLLSSDRTKTVGVTVLPTISRSNYIIAVTSALAVLFVFCSVCGTIALCYMRNIALMYPAVDEMEDNGSVSAIVDIQHRARRTASQLTNPRSEDALSIKTDSSLDETDLDMLLDLDADKNLWRSKGVLFVCDLSRKTTTVLGKKSQLYLWYLLTVSVFYFLPVVQLVITYQKVLHSTGNQNLCYYNFLCAHPAGLLSDFNHVYSNIGYIVLGVLFIGLTRRREQLHHTAVVKNKAVDKCYGIPQHYGLFYAMGAALAIEGVMSGCYHVCPNHHNFQFDTSFMYVISTMCMLKIYHSRHPDVSAGAYSTFAVLAVTILIGMCGILAGTPSFWAIFDVIHLSTCFALSLQIYYLGAWRLRTFNCCRVLKEFYVRIRSGNYRAIFPTFPSRFLIILIANIVNWALAVLGPMYRLGDFASYLLSIFMINLMMYCTFYIIMKLVSKERVGRTPTIFIILTVVCWSLSLYFFFNKSISWKVTPAESRLYNQQCKVLGFYDNHDIWHFLSAASMFFSFMVLLTLDDDLLDVPRDLIAVF